MLVLTHCPGAEQGHTPRRVDADTPRDGGKVLRGIVFCDLCGVVDKRTSRIILTVPEADGETCVRCGSAAKHRDVALGRGIVQRGPFCGECKREVEA